MDTTLEDALLKGVEAHRSGQLQEAQEIYSAIIRAQADHPDANHNLGVLILGMGKAQEALPLFKIAWQTNPGILQYWLSYIDALIQLGDSSEAKSVLELALSRGFRSEDFSRLERSLQQIDGSRASSMETNSRHREVPLERLQSLSDLYNQGKFQEALHDSAEILQEFPSAVVVHNLRGATYAGLQQYDDATRSYKQAIELQPDYFEAYSNLGIAQSRGGDLDAAIESFEQALKLNPDFAEAYNNLGSTQRDRGDLKAAIGSFERAIAISPNIFEFHNNLAGALRAVGESEAAIESFKRALEINPDNADIYNDMGNALKDAGDPDAALDSYERAIKIRPQFAVAYSNIGSVCRERGELQRALSSYEQALKINPHFALACNNMGAVLDDQGNLRASISSFKKAIEIDPDYTEAYCNLGRALRQSGDLVAAVDYYKRAARLQPGNAGTLNMLADTQRELGDMAGAVSSYRMALEIDPNIAETHNNLGLALYEYGLLDAATDSYRRAIEIDPDFGEAYNNIGAALDNGGDFDGAARNYQMAISCQPDFVTAHFNLGAVHQVLGRFEESIASFDRAIEFYRPHTYDLEKIQSFLLRTLFLQGDETRFHTTLGIIQDAGWKNAIIGSLVSRAQLKFKSKLENPYCNHPIAYVMERSLLDGCDFENVFVEKARAVLSSETTAYRKQKLLLNSVQTAGNLFSNQNNLGEDVKSIIFGEIERYREHFAESQEGLIVDWPRDYDLKAWLVKMKNGGAIRPHIHENGWISGSIYINVPRSVQTDSGNLVVAIDDSQELNQDSGNLSKVIEVNTGSICLFPASLYHHTIPFEAEDERIVLAFDVVSKKSSE